MTSARNTFETLDQAYFYTLGVLLNSPEYVCAPRGQKIHEITDYQFRVLSPSSAPIKTADQERNAVIASYTTKETELYDSCSNRVEDFAKASKFWTKIANPDGTINSAYGRLIWKDKSLGNSEYEWEWKPSLFGLENKEVVETKFAIWRTPWEWCVNSLKADKDTRQAILKFSRPDHHWAGNKDFVCTLSGNFLIREDKLNLAMVMRSNDAVKGLAYDGPWFISLMEKMVDELKGAYPNLGVGTYTHLAHSMHLYERDFEVARKMVGQK
jgi:thymidylate synthase